METSPKRERRVATAETDQAPAGTDLTGDWANVWLLLLLYMMQGLPLGISTAVPVLLKSNTDVSYRELAFFSLSFWPFSIKLLWAPIVDALYARKVGRRKTWLIPVQYILGIILVCTANLFDNLLSSHTGRPNIVALMCISLSINFLAATQDIAVDGWALTMLKKNNVGYASMCNSSGQALGIMIGSTMPILLTSESFCNKYLRQTPADGGIVTISILLISCGVFFLLITTLIAIFKKEKGYDQEDDEKFNVLQTYWILWDILQLPTIKILGVALFTAKIGFAAVDNVTTLKLIDVGVSKDDLTIISTAMHGINMVVPLVIGKYTSGPKALSVYLNTVPIRLLLNIPFIFLIYYSPSLIKSNGVVDIPLYYYVILVFLLVIQNIVMYIMFVAIMAFISRISDPRFGGTYMTLMNTINNLGSSWTSTVALGMIDLFTVTECSSNVQNNCSTKDLTATCKTNESDCVITVNGYYVEMVICIIIGIIWYVVFEKLLKNLQKKSPKHWLVNVKKNIIAENDGSPSCSMKMQCDNVLN